MHYPLLFISFLLLLESNATCPEGCSCVQQNGGDYCYFCKNGYYPDYINSDGSFNCGKCPVNCEECSSSTNCNLCKSGYYWNNAACMQCNSNCVTCRTSANQCTSCKNREYISGDNKCLQCDSNCKTCKTTATNCISCKDGNYLSTNNKCEKCPNKCVKCTSENTCTSCINNYFIHDYKCLQCKVNCKTTSDGCKCDTCGGGYYIKNYQCLKCNSPCKTCENSPNSCIKCVTDYYKKENDLNSCYKDPEGYYLDNNIYKQCYQSCKKCDAEGDNSYHNCLECNAEFSFEVKRNEYINCYENCDNYYYFDSRDNFHCTSDKSCPDAYPFLLENKFKCIKFNFDEISNYLLNYGLNGTESKEEEIIFYDNILKNFEKGFTSEAYDTSDIDNGVGQSLKAGKLTISLSNYQNQKNNINNNVTTIDLGECETLLREFYHILDSDNLYIKKIDVIQDGMKTLKVDYNIYAKLFNNLINLNLTVCDKSKITISIPYKITEEIEKLNSSSSYYNDICYTTTSEYGTDITMKDRKKEFIDKDRIVCQEGCYFSEYDYNNSKVKCSCNAKKSSLLFVDMYINKEKIIDNFKNINNLINYKFLICYKKLFNKEGIIKNIGSYTILSIIIFHIIAIFIFCLKQFSSIKKKINKIASEKKHLSDKENKKKEKAIKPTANPSRKKFFSKHKKNIGKSYKSKKNHKIKKIKENNNKNIIKFIDEEINGFSYDLSLKIDKRTYCQYYISLIKTQHSLICAIFNNDDYNSGIVKIDLFFIGFTIEYIVNALFYNDDTMHKIYENKGQFNLETQLPIAIYSTIISTILNYPLNFLALSNDAVINFKNDNSEIKIKEKIEKLKKILIIKFISYFIISFLLLLFFWYYISIFCVIYKNTQFHLLKDTLMSIGLSLILPFGIYLLPGIFRIPSLSDKKKKRKCLYNFSKILQSF